MWEKMGWVGGRNGVVPNTLNAPGVSAGKTRVHGEENEFQDSKPEYDFAGHQSLGAAPVYSSVNEAVLTDFILLEKNFLCSLPCRFLFIFWLYHLPETQTSLEVNFLARSDDLGCSLKWRIPGEILYLAKVPAAHPASRLNWV